MSDVMLDGELVTQHNARRLVLARRPEMRDESHKNNSGRRYWLIREGRAHMWFASGFFALVECGEHTIEYRELGGEWSSEL